MPAPPGSTEWNEFQQQARAALGETRFAEWQRAQDPDYRELARVAARFKLPATVPTELYGYKQLIEEQRVRLESDANLSAQQREAGFQAIASETQRGFKEAMGEKAFRHYQKRTANPWVQGAR